MSAESISATVRYLRAELLDKQCNLARSSLFDHALVQNSEYGTKLNWSKPIPSYYLASATAV
jgi:hypothetical protein